MKDIQQLIKQSSQEGTYEKVFPKTFLDAVKDKKTGLSLTDILSGFNMYFLSYTGSVESTRLQVPTCLRKTGLWITYVKYDKTVITEWYAGEDISDDAWGLDGNWRIGSSMLVGDITISSEGNWIVNGTDTGVKAQGDQGTTPLLRINDNKLQVSYTNGSSYTNINDTLIYTKFRENNNKLQQSTDLGNTWTDISDYIAAWFRWKSEESGGRDKIGKIQISRDGGNTWSDFSDYFTNSLYIKDYVSTISNLPSSAALGDIYGVGPAYASEDTQHTNPIYRLYVKTSSGWVDNGQFTSISAGVTQEITDSEFTVPSNSAIRNKLCLQELGDSTQFPVSQRITTNISKNSIFVTKGLCFNKNTPGRIHANAMSKLTPYLYIPTKVCTFNYIWGSASIGSSFIYFDDNFKYVGESHESEVVSYIYDPATENIPQGTKYMIVQFQDEKFSIETTELLNTGISFLSELLMKNSLTEIIGNLERYDFAQTENINLSKSFELFPSYHLKKGDKIVLEITDIVASDYFAVFLKTGDTNITFAESVLNSTNLRLEYIATSDVEINSILLFKNAPITLSCTIQIYSDLGLKGELSNLQTKVGVVEIGLSESQNEITEIQTTLEDVAKDNKSIDLIKNALITDDYIQVKDYEVIDGKYIDYLGNCSDLAQMDVWFIPVQKGDKFRIEWKSSEGIARMYGVYSTDSSANINSSTLIELGTEPTEASESIVEITNKNAKSLAVTWYSIYDTKVFKSEPSLKYDFTEMQVTVKNCHHYSYDGDKLAIAFLDNGRETTYFFGKCMANELFTFSKVGTRDTTRQIASSEGIAEGVDITYYNETYSDNIGPISMRNGGWAGGNHLKGSQKTAKTESVTIYADNKVIENGSSGFANLVKVEVVNTIYDPSQEIAGDILTQKLAIERVTYIVHANTVEVGVSLSFVNTANKLASYYGMQSMFVNEDYILVPNGSCKNWTAVTKETTLIDKKITYPNVNRFIEKSSANKTYQSTYLMGVGLGKHTYLKDNDMIFSRSYEKDYHSCVMTYTDVSEKTLRWKGCYTFFVEPLIDNEQLFVYWGYINNQKAIYIYAYGAFDGFVELKQTTAMDNIKVIENTGFVDNDGTTDFIIGGGGLYLRSEKDASLIMIVT